MTDQATELLNTVASSAVTDIENRFTYHPPHGTQAERYSAIRKEARGLALLIQDSVPPSREKSLAFTKLEEAVMWANASIARNEPAPPVTPTGYRERVIQEKLDLEAKLSRLLDFISDLKKFSKVEPDEQGRLADQAELMRRYLRILQERIDHFPDFPVTQ